MPKPSRRIPSYRHYKPKNLGVVRIDGKDEYLGKYNSPESWEKYHRLIAEWLSRGCQSACVPPNAHQESNDATISSLLLAYWRFAKGYYSKDGLPTKELSCMREALRPLRELYGQSHARDFGPKALKAVRAHMIEQGLCRGLVNRRLGP